MGNYLKIFEKFILKFLRPHLLSENLKSLFKHKVQIHEMDIQIIKLLLDLLPAWENYTKTLYVSHSKASSGDHECQYKDNLFLQRVVTKINV